MRPPRRRPAREVLRWATPIALEHRTLLASAYAFRIAGVALGLATPWPFKVIVDNVLSQRPAPKLLRTIGLGHTSAETLVLAMAAAIVLTAVARAFVESCHAVRSARFRERLNTDMRDRMMGHLQQLPPTIRVTHRSGELALRLVGDVDQFVRFLARTVPTIIEYLLTTAATLALMLWLQPELTLFAALLMPGLAAIVRVYGTRLGQASRERRRREGEVAGLAQEIVRGLPVIQALGGDDHARQRFRLLNANSLDAGVAESRVASDMERAIRIAHGLATAVLVAGGALLVLNGRLTLGALTVLATYLTQLLKPVERLNDVAETTSKGLAAGERLLALLEQQPAIQDAPDAVAIARARGVLELRDVCFSYGDSRRTAVLRGVNLRLVPGELAVLVGASGAGKSTLLSLLVRLFDPSSGDIRLDGRPLPAYTLRSLRQQIAMMSQDTHLFAGSLREALTPTGERLADADIWRALALVAMEDVVRGIPGTLDAPLGEDGINLSGGQRQRLSLARAFLLDRPILLLDEPTSNVDPESEAIIASALSRMRDRRTCLAITHRLSLFDHADVVYRLEDGQIVRHPAGLRLVSGQGAHRV
ncbi:MAG TPA: ABC transporter ATP-binding protein [Vicinamibacterales bacterium]|nr:ABC transporter ATP-binding protein [Vicinamibacterales bacterium]